MAKDFLPQLDRDPGFDLNRLRTAARWFALGYFKKAVIADNISPVVDVIYANPSAYGAAEHWFAAFGFYMQIYGDFSGYTDMAWGSALALGFELPENFRMPFWSHSFTEFWQRWHMSLLKWIRDYVYIPLGGNRVSPFRHKFNIFFTMFVSGLWHGANWTYVSWGVLHGVLLALESSLKRRERGPDGGEVTDGTRSTATGLRILAAHFHNYAMPVLILILGAYFTTIFRSRNMEDSLLILTRMACLDDFPSRMPSLSLYRPVLLGTMTVLIGHILGKMILEKKRWRIDPPVLLEIALIPFLILLFTQIAATDVEAFIYFVF
jgi:D-alanyl-lipoteichoic acid acyltransferase DltB (MBOAT superfamily)